MGHVGYTPIYTCQHDICLFHNSMTVLIYVWLILYHISQVLFYRTSSKGFFPPSCTSAARHTSLSVTLVALPIKLHLISFKL